MDYQIDCPIGKGFVRIRVYNSITADLERSFAKEAIETAHRAGLPGFYADVRGAPNIATTLDQYRLAYEDMTNFGLDKKSKIAIVHLQDDHSHDFIETVFNNAGYSCKLFTDEDEACGWLGS
ncbi:MAG: hypothetical protein AB7E73_09575 [Burkholderiales bacterium]